MLSRSLKIVSQFALRCQGKQKSVHRNPFWGVRSAVKTEEWKGGKVSMEWNQTNQRRRAVALLLIAAVLLPSTRARAAGNNPTVRVGLFYGENALPAANLLNSQNAGYQFGYFNSELQFVPLGATDETAITMLKADTMYLSAGSYTQTRPSGGFEAIGGSHVQLPAAYSSFEQAEAAAAAVGGFPVWTGETYYVRSGTYISPAEAQNAAAGLSGTAVSAGTNAVTVVKTGTDDILFQMDAGTYCSLAVRPGIQDGITAVTWFKQHKYYGSFQYQRIDGGNLTVSNVLPVEEYIKGVVPNEMSNAWPLEALKAQAVCARTYAYIKVEGSKHLSQGFDLCNTTDCQVYQGLTGAGDRSDQAVEETEGECIWYQGARVEANYFSSDGGATEDASNVWTNSAPYLIGVLDPYEAYVEDQISLQYDYHWTKTFTKEELAAMLRSKKYQCADVVDFRITQTTATGNVLTVAVIDSAGKSWPFSKEKARTFFGLPSQRYTISGGSGIASNGSGYTVAGGSTLNSLDGTYAISGSGAVSAITTTPYVISGSGTSVLTPSPLSPPVSSVETASNAFTISGSGLGHLVGMSQWGANAMAKQGYRYDQILKFYYTGIEVRT